MVPTSEDLFEGRVSPEAPTHYVGSPLLEGCIALAAVLAGPSAQLFGLAALQNLQARLMVLPLGVHSLDVPALARRSL